MTKNENVTVSDLCMREVAKEMVLGSWMGFAPLMAATFTKRYQELMRENGYCPICGETLEGCTCDEVQL